MTITDYVSCYGNKTDSSICAPAADESYILRYWTTNKAPLKEMFDGKLILEKEVNYQKPYSELRELFSNEYFAYNSPYSAFRKELNNLISSFPLEQFDAAFGAIGYVLSNMPAMINNRYQGENTISFPLPNEKEIKLRNGDKPMRFFGKIARAYNLKTFEAFRIWHSQALNDSRLTGTLCLSIHPLDFLTMSDNSNDWSSCLSWVECGSYRSGTVECMNSPYVVVAYLKSSSESFEGWNSKKWRCLFLVHDDVITSIKNYPFESEELTLLSLNWLRELSSNSYGDIVAYSAEDDNIVVEDEVYRNNICFTCGGNMYCDFGYTTHYGIFSERENYDIDYSGPLVCMRCGEDMEYDDGDSDEVICASCASMGVCEYCGEKTEQGDLTFTVDEKKVCLKCLAARYVFSSATHEFYPKAACVTLILEGTNKSCVVPKTLYPSRMWSFYFTHNDFSRTVLTSEDLTAEGLKLFS